jgi:hypothetical protein
MIFSRLSFIHKVYWCIVKHKWLGLQPIMSIFMKVQLKSFSTLVTKWRMWLSSFTCHFTPRQQLLYWRWCGPQSPYHESIWGEDIYLHAFLTSALDRGKWSTSWYGQFTPRKGNLLPTDKRMTAHQSLSGCFGEKFQVPLPLAYSLHIMQASLAQLWQWEISWLGIKHHFFYIHSVLTYQYHLVCKG